MVGAAVHDPGENEGVVAVVQVIKLFLFICRLCCSKVSCGLYYIHIDNCHDHHDERTARIRYQCKKTTVL